ncbi:hypothetical protein E1B28_005674 [Marasmius oreades]|uniref:Extracellular membrane protein CFEM domain-containing protein n=1 Tax=Marasmius oreades TaxID=181124 RepID=A0A9P7S4D1_9AGAR|nr:uncharacterized protein E1B28_005674 [Marasmius oreades]KAG7094867.1 hypothetical protein E1B28_005674 [Marasmius oreades]
MRPSTTVIASFLATVPLVYGKPDPNNILRSVPELSIRQDLPSMPPIPQSCQKTCSSAGASSQSCSTADCACTDSTASGIETCLNCVIAEDKSQTDKAQKFMDFFTDGCKTLGKSVGDRKLSGKSSGSGNGGSQLKASLFSSGVLGATTGLIALLL